MAEVTQQVAEGQLEVLEKTWLSDHLSLLQLCNCRQAICHLHPGELPPQTWRQLNTERPVVAPSYDMTLRFQIK